MKVKLFVSRSGADGAFSPGDEIEVSADEAKRMVADGQAEFVRSERRETSVKKPRAEKAAK